MSYDVSVIKTGTANLASVLSALKRLNVTAHVTDNPDEVASARRVLVPGVGHFGATMAGLTQTGLADLLRQRVTDGKPTMGICIGMQVFCETSEESPGARGMGVISGTVQRFGTSVRVPQLGWNNVTPDDQCTLVSEGYAYYANSYCLKQIPEGWGTARTEHGEPFVGALERGAVLMCQFHPELSGAWGMALLRRWLQGGV